MTKPKKKLKLEPGCSCNLCGASLSIQSGLLRCSSPKCGHLHRQGLIFEEPRVYEPVSKYPDYHRQVPKAVDEEFK